MAAEDEDETFGSVGLRAATVGEPYVEKVGRDAYAYVQPDGSWCLSNSGLIVGGKEAMIVDTLSDLPKTRLMLRAFEKILEERGAVVTVLVNTHHNLDHVWGNQLVVSRYPKARTLASRRAVEEMRHDVRPDQLMEVLDKARRGQLGRQPGSFGNFLSCRFSHLSELDAVKVTPPKETFEGTLVLNIGGRKVTLIECGPAHTSGDVIVHVEDSSLVFAGDLLVNKRVPVVWTSNPSGWIKACNHMLDLNPAAVVPGHGPVADGPYALRDLQEYLVFVVERTKRAVEDRGEPSVEAVAINIAAELPLKFKAWGEQERHVINVLSVYKQLAESQRNQTAIEALNQAFPTQNALYIMYKFSYRMKHRRWESTSPCKNSLRLPHTHWTDISRRLQHPRFRLQDTLLLNNTDLALFSYDARRGRQAGPLHFQFFDPASFSNRHAGTTLWFTPLVASAKASRTLDSIRIPEGDKGSLLIKVCGA